MTPEERAHVVVEAWSFTLEHGIWGSEELTLCDRIAAAIRAAVEAEREACAVIVEDTEDARDTLTSAAAAIRRGGTR